MSCCCCCFEDCASEGYTKFSFAACTHTHTMCLDCLKRWAENGRQMFRCPLCQAPITNCDGHVPEEVPAWAIDPKALLLGDIDELHQLDPGTHVPFVVCCVCVCVIATPIQLQLARYALLGLGCQIYWHVQWDAAGGNLFLIPAPGRLRLKPPLQRSRQPTAHEGRRTSQGSTCLASQLDLMTSRRRGRVQSTK
jgi:hypothetical protein